VFYGFTTRSASLGGNKEIKGNNKFSNATQKNKFYCEHYKKNGHNKEHYWALHHKLFSESNTRKKLLKVHKFEGKEIGASDVDAINYWMDQSKTPHVRKSDFIDKEYQTGVRKSSQLVQKFEN